MNTEYKQALEDIASASTERSLNDLRVKYLGRRGILTDQLRAIGEMPQERRAEAGAELNRIRRSLEEALTARQAELVEVKVESETGKIDLTVPASLPLGHLHPVTQVLADLLRVFRQMGYQVVEGPEIETEWYNFEALNIGPDHPARDMQDTFYLAEGNLPRTHTSGMQVRYMERNKPPIRIVSPGKVYRNEDEDARHSWMFYQLEGLVVDENISLADLKGTLLAMIRGILGEESEVRLRPSFFPYTEPSVEMDATCIICGGKGCRTCSGTGWLELGGAGMVHPQVLRNVGIDPERFSGFAFGFGPERIAALKFGVPDIREFWRPNLDFLGQF